jgi:predicted nucleic acid-binding protein
MILVVDANVVAPLFIPEERSEDAQTLVSSARAVVAPRLLHLEIASVLLRHQRRGSISLGRAEAALDQLTDLVGAVDDSGVLGQAYEIASGHGGHIYDAIYIETAASLDVPLVTEDRAMQIVARKAHVIALSIADALRQISEEAR